MRLLNLFKVLFIAAVSLNVYAEEKKFLTVEKLVQDGFVLLSGLQVIDIMNNNTIKVTDIETDAVNVSKNNTLNDAIDRGFVEAKGDKASAMFDTRLLARAPALEGDIHRRVVGDELVATDGVRTYRYRLYKKQEKIYAVRDVDYGNVFYEVKVK